MLCNDILQEVMRRKACGRRADLLSGDACEISYLHKKKEKMQKVRPKDFVVYGLRGKYGDTHLTKREAECMVQFIKGKTIDGVANVLKLSPRTVEYYLKNMKAKLGCKTKTELIDQVYASGFMQRYVSLAN